MLQKFKWFVIAFVLLVLGGVSIALQPGPPDTECAKGNTSSGFMDKTKDCAISSESMDRIADYTSSPKWFNIVGAVLILAAIVVAVIGLVKLLRRKRPAPTA